MTVRLWRTLLLAIGLVMAAGAMTAGALHAAPVVVLSSTVPGLQPGSMVDSATAVAVPAGGMVMINDAAGKTRTIAGPYDGPIGETAAKAGDGGMMANLGRLVASRDTEQTRLGAVRAAPDQQLRDPALITVAHSATQCGLPEAPLRLWRPGTMDGDNRLTITDLASGASAERVWHAGRTVIDWPATLPARDGARYRIRLEIAPRPVELELHRAPAGLDTPARLAAWMESVGCRRQALLLLDTLTAPQG
ncbi:MAG: hypothetical protein KDC18_01255 [Alphaproteobacteria bacterium]|nr:hypothetical protein [Alphaproteobacteria bacterium]MCB9928223.1 hypothetical protein [Alphaproteobacteria bacterium]